MTPQEYARAYQNKHKVRLRRYIRTYRLRRLYGLSREAHSGLVAEHGGLCAICHLLLPELSVDHCHMTGRVAGLLCQTCNMGLGLFTEDPEILRRAADYVLERK